MVSSFSVSQSLKNPYGEIKKNGNGLEGGELTPFSPNYKISKICLFQLLISQKLPILSQRKF